MSEEVVGRALDPFFTTRAPGEGTGLGLALVHRIVTGTGGTLDIQSEPGRGTTIAIRLPVTDLELPEAEASTGEAPAPDPFLPAAGSTRILFVDDEEMVRRTTRMILSRLGYEVEEAATPESALRKVEEDPAAFDLVVTDQAMPGMTGLVLARRIRKLRPALPTLIASGYLDEAAMRPPRGVEVCSAAGAERTLVASALNVFTPSRGGGEPRRRGRCTLRCRPPRPERPAAPDTTTTRCGPRPNSSRTPWVTVSSRRPGRSTRTARTPSWITRPPRDSGSPGERVVACGPSRLGRQATIE